MAEVLPSLGLQASLEAGAAELIRTRLGYTDASCARQFDGRPPPSAGDVFVSVWSENERESDERSCLSERMGVLVTVTLRLKVPRDRWKDARDELEKRLNEIRALLHKDTLNSSVINKANELGGRGIAATRHVGFQQGMYFAGFDKLRVVDGKWFGSSAGGPESGLAQTARFKDARCVQGISSAR